MKCCFDCCCCYCCCCCSCSCCYRCCWSQKSSFKVWLKLGQEQFLVVVESITKKINSKTILMGCDTIRIKLVHLLHLFKHTSLFYYFSKWKTQRKMNIHSLQTFYDVWFFLISVRIVSATSSGVMSLVILTPTVFSSHSPLGSNFRYAF